MAIDVEYEELVTLGKARIPGNPSLCTVWRWVLTGVGGVKLESIKAGGRRMTSQAAISRFMQALNGGAVKVNPTQAAIDAGRRLERCGA